MYWNNACTDVVMYYDVVMQLSLLHYSFIGYFG